MRNDCDLFDSFSQRYLKEKESKFEDFVHLIHFFKNNNAMSSSSMSASITNYFIKNMHISFIISDGHS